MQVLLLNILDHPHLIQIGIFRFSQERSFALVFVRLFILDHEDFSGDYMLDVVVIARPKLYLSLLHYKIMRLLFDLKKIRGKFNYKGKMRLRLKVLLVASR